MKNNGWKSYLCLEIVEKMNRFALLNFNTARTTSRTPNIVNVHVVTSSTGWRKTVERGRISDVS